MFWTTYVCVKPSADTNIHVDVIGDTVTSCHLYTVQLSTTLAMKRTKNDWTTYHVAGQFSIGHEKKTQILRDVAQTSSLIPSCSYFCLNISILSSPVMFFHIYMVGPGTARNIIYKSQTHLARILYYQLRINTCNVVSGHHRNTRI